MYSVYFVGIITGVLGTFLLPFLYTILGVWVSSILKRFAQYLHTMVVATTIESLSSEKVLIARTPFNSIGGYRIIDNRGRWP